MAPRTKEQALELIRESDLPEDLKAQMEEELRPTIVINTRKYDPSSLSYFGGVPLAPESWEWPIWDAAKWAYGKRGYEWVKEELPLVPLTFIGQINLSDLPVIEGLPPFPRKGILYFFCECDICPRLYESLDPGAGLIRYSKVAASKLKPLLPPDYVQPVWRGHERLKRYSMTFSEEWQLPRDVYAFVSTPPVELRVQYRDFMAHRFEQYAPDALFGHFQENEHGTIARNILALENDEKRKKSTVEEERTDSPRWLPLLQVTAFLTAADGRLTFIVRHDLLEKGIFEELYVSWAEGWRSSLLFRAPVPQHSILTSSYVKPWHRQLKNKRLS